MSKSLKIKLIVAFLIICNTYQIIFEYSYRRKSLLNLILIIVLIVLLIDIFRRRKTIFEAASKLNLPYVPKVLKYLIVIIFSIQFVCLMTSKTIYPFADVGMFKQATKERIYEPELTRPIYYIQSGSDVKMIHLRMEHTFWGDNLLNWTYNNEYTFSANYQYKSSEKNFEFLKNALLKEKSMSLNDTIKVGLLSVNYETGKTSFNPNVKDALIFNDTATVHYGKLFIPKYLK